MAGVESGASGPDRVRWRAQKRGSCRSVGSSTAASNSALTRAADVGGTGERGRCLVARLARPMSIDSKLAPLVRGVHHIAIVVKSIADARKQYEGVLGMRAS